MSARVPTLNITLCGYGSAGSNFILDVPFSMEAFCKDCDTLGPGDPRFDHLSHSLNCQYGLDPTFTSNLILEYVRFLELKCRVNDQDGSKITPSPLIDLVWAVHFRDFVEYERLCRALYEEHSASSYQILERHEPVEVTPLKLAATCLAYEARFNEIPDAQYWATNAVLILRRRGEDKPECCLAKIVKNNMDIPPQLLRLIYQQVELRAGQTLQEYGVQHGSIIHLLLRLRGC